eukprot:m.8241 g.8241  ORF g.8241 m.8241 type:complete len:434 (-) comp2517_c0_seq1:154-1455(-)
MRGGGVSPEMIDEMHQKINNSLQVIKSNAELYKRVSQAATQWHDKLQEAVDAQSAFFATLDAVSQKAYAAPGMSNLGMGFNNLSDCARGLGELQRDVARSLADEVVAPLDARVSGDVRNVQRMSKEYNKLCTEQAENIYRAERDVERLEKRVRKGTADNKAIMQLRSAQRAVAEYSMELDALRAHTLRRVLTEERSRYARLMVGVLDALKVQKKACQRSLPALNAVIGVCQPLCANPGELPPDFNPMMKRGGARQPGPPQPAAGYPHPMSHPGPLMGPRGPPPSSMMLRATSPPGVMPPMPPQAHYRPAAENVMAGLKPNQLVAKYPFSSQEPGQLDFAAGHVVEIDGPAHGGNWEYGVNLMTGKAGWFPVSYFHAPPRPPVARNGGPGGMMHQRGSVNLPPVDYDDDGPAPPRADYDGGGGDADPAQNFTGE